ncbi:hypothetical protein KCU90_g212, partial [Aureobasidium melanogenum]
MATPASEDPSMDPRFHNLHEELRSVLFNGLSNLSPSQLRIPQVGASEASQSLDFSSATVKIPQARLVRYLQNWITECAPQLDKDLLLYCTLSLPFRRDRWKGETVDTCTAGQRLGHVGNWRRHVEGSASLFEVFGVNGFSGGLLQAVFWMYARMELCGSLTSDGAETMVLALPKWIPDLDRSVTSPEDGEKLVRSLFHEKKQVIWNLVAQTLATRDHSRNSGNSFG